MKIAVAGGHTPTAPGASGYLDELECDRALKDKTIAELSRRGHEVIDVTADSWADVNTDLSQQVARANASGADLFVSHHFNAFNGSAHGTECWYYSGDTWGRDISEFISHNTASALGVANRGAKGTTGLYVLNCSNMTAVLTETCFVDNYDDAQAWWNTSWEDIVGAICDGIEQKYWSKTKPSDLRTKRQKVQDKYSLSDMTMQYLDFYKYSNELYSKLLSGETLSDFTYKWLEAYDYGDELVSKLRGV